MTLRVVTERPEPIINLDVERSLLGALLNDARQFDVIAGIVTADDFGDPLLGGLFDRLRLRHEAGGNIDLKLAIASMGELAGQEIATTGVTVGTLVARLYAEATSSRYARDYAIALRALADRRRLVALSEDIAAQARTDAPPREIAAAALDQLDLIAEAASETKTPSMSIAEAADASLSAMTYAMQHPGELPGMSWGLRDLDARTGGIHPGELVIVAARPSMGKTALGISCARYGAQAGRHGRFQSLEMNETALAFRVLADLAYDAREPIEYQRIRLGDMRDAEAQRITDAQRTLRGLPLIIDPQPGLSIAQISARARRQAQKLEREGKRLSVLWVDHLHLVRASDRYKGNRTSEITEVSGALKSLAKELGIAVVALAQLSRGPESREDKRPMLSDLRDSGSIEQDADTIIFLYRESYYLERSTRDDPNEDAARLARLAQCSHELEALIAKQRSGPIGTVKLFFDVGCNAVRNLARPHAL